MAWKKREEIQVREQKFQLDHEFIECGKQIHLSRLKLLHSLGEDRQRLAQHLDYPGPRFPSSLLLLSINSVTTANNRNISRLTGVSTTVQEGYGRERFVELRWEICNMVHSSISRIWERENDSHFTYIHSNASLPAAHSPLSYLPRYMLHCTPPQIHFRFATRTILTSPNLALSPVYDMKVVVARG